MRFDLTGPCADCPFLREGGIRVHPTRARDFAQGQLNGHPAGSFPCHRTTIETVDAEGEETPGWGPQTQYCGGAMAFAAKQESYNQVLQIAMRVGWWHPGQITPETRERVFDSVFAMMGAPTQRTLPRSKRPPMRSTPKRRTF